LFSGPNSSFTGRPVVNLSFAVNYAIGGLSVRGYHVWNMALHVCCALLLFGVVRRTLELPRLADRFGPTAVASCAIGMGCKETMVTAPAMVVLYDSAFAFDSVKEAFRARWRLYAGLASTWMVFGGLLLSSRAGAGDFSGGISPWTYLLNQTIIITHYLRLTVWPRALIAFYGWPLSLYAGDVLPYALPIMALGLLACVSWFRWRPLGFLAVWFFITLSPTSSIVPLTTEVGAERRMYVPLMAVVVLAVMASALLLERARKERAWASVFALVSMSTALAAGTVARNREYASAVALARTIVERRPMSVAHHILGEELQAAGDHEEAVRELREAVPGDSRASYHLGLWLFDDGRLDESISQLQAFVATWGLPYHLVPRWLEPNATEVVTARTRIGDAYLREKRWPQAVDQFRLVLEMSPSDAGAHGLLGDALLGEEKFDEAAAHYREYLKSRPDDAVALIALGIALDSAAHDDDAIQAFRRAVDVDPRNGDAERDLAAALFDRRDADEAALHARRAAALAPADPEAHDLLGRTLALQGKLSEARAEFQRASNSIPRTSRPARTWGS
jgi:protein O-mannosyl-transferase